MLSSKSITNGKIISVENEKILPNNEIAEVLNNFFSDIVKALVIPQNVCSGLFIGNDPTLRAIVQYPKHPSILAIKEKSKK